MVTIKKRMEKVDDKHFENKAPPELKKSNVVLIWFPIYALKFISVW
jgi:hypothetical protein